jgi:hypothetical protein
MLTSKAQSERTLNDNPSSADAAKRVQYINSCIEILQEFRGLVGQLEDMVIDELNPDWDWKTGIAAQMVIVRKQIALHERLDSIEIG